jgi:hypothetical protein
VARLPPLAPKACATAKVEGGTPPAGMLTPGSTTPATPSASRRYGPKRLPGSRWNSRVPAAGADNDRAALLADEVSVIVLCKRREGSQPEKLEQVLLRMEGWRVRNVQNVLRAGGKDAGRYDFPFPVG